MDSCQPVVVSSRPLLLIVTSEESKAGDRIIWLPSLYQMPRVSVTMLVSTNRSQCLVFMHFLRAIDVEAAGFGHRPNSSFVLSRPFEFHV